ncbi:hypothetical protein [Streptomyces sp. NPDC006134]
MGEHGIRTLTGVQTGGGPDHSTLTAVFSACKAAFTRFRLRLAA